MDYQELELTLQSADAERFEVVARSEAFGEARERFVPPLDEAAVAMLGERAEQEVATRIGRRVGLGGRAPEAARTAKAGPDVALPSPRPLGEELFQALFAGSVGEMYRRCVGELQPAEPGRRGLRLRLAFRHDDPALGFLTALPWELLWDESGGGFLGRQPERTLVRDLSAGQRVEPLLVEPPLRILIVDSGASDLALHLERRRIGRVLRENEGFEVFVLDHPTLGELREALEEREIHVLHFMGHGGYEGSLGVGAIFLVDRFDRERQVLGEVLAEQLLGLKHLRLAVFNTCKSGMQAGARGVASARLLRADPPAIVAMQYPISDQAAMVFSRRFYGALALGHPVDAAIGDARLALAAESSEWATPVLYMPSRDGILFRFQGAPRPRSRAVGLEELEGRRLHLGIHSLGTYGVEEMREEADQVKVLTQYFDGKVIRDRDLWHREVFPRLTVAIEDAAREGRPLLLDFAAHGSIAFAAGWLLEAKRGMAIWVRQRVPDRGSEDWGPRVDSGGAGESGGSWTGPVWAEEPDRPRSAESQDVALAISVSRRTLDAVESYLDSSGLDVSRVIHARIAPDTGPGSVRGAAHAWQLADVLARLIEQRTAEEQRSTLHVFGAAPNALLFRLGQLARGFGSIQLYEHEQFGTERQFGSYAPSLRLPPPETS